MKVTIKDYGLCVTPLTIIRFFINNKKKYKRKYRRISQIVRIRNYFDFDRYIIKLTEKSRAAARREKCLESSFHLASKIDLKHEETKRSMPFLSFVQRLKSKRPPLTN